MFLKNKNIIFKIRRSKVTDYAALILCLYNVDTLNICVKEFGSKKFDKKKTAVRTYTNFP